MKKNKVRAENAGASRPALSPEVDAQLYSRTHLLIGWWSLLAFLSLGIGLEYMHAFRVPWYLDLGEPEVRRLMWRLAHAHGVLISLVHVGFAFTVAAVDDWHSRSRDVASCCLTAAGLFMPLGFFLGGLFIYDGDPGLGVFLVPPGALLLFTAVLTTGLAMLKARSRMASARTE